MLNNGYAKWVKQFGDTEIILWFINIILNLKSMFSSLKYDSYIFLTKNLTKWKFSMRKFRFIHKLTLAIIFFCLNADPSQTSSLKADKIF